MDYEKAIPWMVPALQSPFQGSYIYPSSYPNIVSNALRDDKPDSGNRSMVAPGHTLRGYTRELRGRLAGAPWVRPSRKFLLYVPGSYRENVAMPLVVWLHGCRQSAEEFRDGTGIIPWADQRGLMVLMPRQSKWANPLGCWNWFDAATQNGLGETALILAQTRFIRSRWNIDPQRVWIAGMSSGAALAACMVVHGRGEFQAAAFVSGLADGAASSAMTAAKVMKGETEVDVTEIAHRVSQRRLRPFDKGISNEISNEISKAIKDGAKHLPDRRTDVNGHADREDQTCRDDLTKRRDHLKPLRSLIIHGDLDTVAVPHHADELARQMLALNGETPVASPLRSPDQRTETLFGERQLIRDQFNIHGKPCVDVVRIAGLGHAWSGGDPRFPFNDPSPPNATQLILDFFKGVPPEQAKI